MTTTTPSDPAGVYRSFLAALNDQDLVAAAGWVDVERYREDCVGFTGGFVGWDDATKSLRSVWRGIPDLHARLDHLVADGDQAMANLTVTGTHRGLLFGLPGLGRTYEVSMFDRVVVQQGRIVERVQQSDNLGMFQRLLMPHAAAAGAALVAGVALFVQHRTRPARGPR